MSGRAEPEAVPSRRDFYVVGIGASAGGLGALRTLFGNMPAEPGFACVVVVHLSPEHESHMVELLQPYTRMPVQQVNRTMPLEPNHVYVIPPNVQLAISKRELHVSPRPDDRSQYTPIDAFFISLAKAAGTRAIGVILSGTASDGALGLREIKAAGGLTLVQLPESAKSLEEAVRVSPRQAAYFNQLGITYRHQGQFNKAREAYEEAIALDGNYAAPHLNLGILHDLYLGDPKRALELYDRYLALSPGGDATVTKWIADLKNRKPAPITVSQKGGDKGGPAKEKE